MEKETQLQKRPAIQSILFLCTFNSVRSQIAEALMRHLYGDRFIVCSAGIAPSGIHPSARKVLQEAGIDISLQRSKSVSEFRDRSFDYVVTLCSGMAGSCVVPPEGTRVIDHPFNSPPEIGSEEVILQGFRELREEILSFLKETFG